MSKDERKDGSTCYCELVRVAEEFSWGSYVCSYIPQCTWQHNHFAGIFAHPGDDTKRLLVSSAVNGEYET
jgi:hypothetical protein